MTGNPLERGLRSLGLEPTQRALDKLNQYLEELSRWNRVYNLTRVPEPEWISHHLLDSLSIVPFVSGQSVLDAGSGGGMPGLPLAIWFPDKQFTLLDSNGKKTRFLTQVKIALALENVTVVQVRAESFVGKFDHVTCRAFASLADIASMTAHLLTSTGSVLAMKGELSAEELAMEGASLQLDRVQSLEVPGIEAVRNLAILKPGA